MKNRRTMLIGVGVVLVAVILVVGAVLTSRKGASGTTGLSAPGAASSGSAASSPGSAESVAIGGSTSTAAGSSGARPPAGAQPGAAKPPYGPVTEKTPLQAISGAPAKTLAMVEPKFTDAGAAYAVTFVPYGFGPGGKSRALIVRVNTSKAIGQVKKPYEFANRNVLLDVTGIPSAKAIALGGTYSGTIVLMPQNGMLVPSLRDVR